MAETLLRSLCGWFLGGLLVGSVIRRSLCIFCSGMF